MSYLIRLGKVVDGFSHFFVKLGGLLVIFLMLLISFGAISRYAFGQARGWVTEVSAYSILVLAFLGSPEVLKKGKHIDIDIFVNMLSPKNRSIISMLTSFTGLALCAALFWAALGVTIENYHEHAMLVGMVEIPKYYLFSFMPLGFLLLAIYFAQDVYRHLTALKFSTKA
ncbi:MAG: TRAP transporter small permease [Carboxydocellales bacterium]